MRTGRFAGVKTFNGFLILNPVSIVGLLIVCGFIATGCAQIAEAEEVKDATVESDLAELLTTVYCYCGCTRETIEVCTCATARNIENNFRDRLLAGETAEQIRTDYLDTYGTQYYAVMPVEGINLLAYAMPVIILVAIGGFAFGVLRRLRQRQPAAAADTTGEKSASEVSHETVQQVEAELERYKQES